MNLICNASRYTDWRGKVGNSILLSLFTLSMLLNVALIVLIIITRSATTTIVNYQIIQFLIGNVMVAVSQVYLSVVHLFFSKSCEKIYISYFLHQVGFAITTSALMTITVAHLRMVINKTCTIHVGRTVAISELIYIAVGIGFICMPFAVKSKAIFLLSLLYQTTLDIASMIYCYLAMKVLRRIRVAEFLLSGNLLRLKYDAKIIVPSNVITVTFRVFFLFYYLSPLLLTKEQFQASKILSYWIGMIFYLQLLLIPVIYCYKRNIMRRRNKVHSVIGIASGYAFNNSVLVTPRFSTTHTL